jgi:hypothetical protein
MSKEGENDTGLKLSRTDFLLGSMGLLLVKGGAMIAGQPFKDSAVSLAKVGKAEGNVRDTWDEIRQDGAVTDGEARQFVDAYGDLKATRESEGKIKWCLFPALVGGMSAVAIGAALAFLESVRVAVAVIEKAKK